MKHAHLTVQDLLRFHAYLVEEEKSPATIEKYLRDATAFCRYAGDTPVSKTLTVSYKQSLQQNYAIRSINSMLSSVNAFLAFLGYRDCQVKGLRQQRQIYCAESRALSKEEYLRLLEAARGNSQLYMLLQTICSTGIRVSELKYFTVEALAQGEIHVRCKSKTRTILVPGKLKKQLMEFARERHISSGIIFRTRIGNPLDRSNIWAQMKRLCQRSGVNPSKVFPHNLRKLFARTFYKNEKDIAKLADILGHGSIETTRIYIMSTGTEHRRKLDRLGLLI